MNDQPTPTDEELSQAIDGLADDDLRSRIAASPEATARLAELQAVADRLAGAAVPPLDDDRVDRLIAGALDVPLAPAQPGRGGRRGPAPWLVAAAVVLLMALGLTLVWAGQDSSSDRAASTSGALDKSAADLESSDASGGGSSGVTSSTIAGQMSGRTTAGAEAGSPATTMAPSGASSAAQYLGSYPDGAALRTATATSFAAAETAYAKDQGATAPGDAAVPTSKAVDRCAEQLQITLSMKAPPTASAWATVDGKQVLVYEFATTSSATNEPTTLVAAVGIDACEQVVIFER